MESNGQELKGLKLFKEFVPIALIVLGATATKVLLYKARTKNIKPTRLLFVGFSSLFTGTVSGMICYALGVPHWVAYLVVSACTLSSEAIIEVYLANSKSTVLKAWDWCFEWFFNWLDKGKKNKK